MEILSLDHIHIYAESAERSAEFYARHFQAPEVHRSKNVHDQDRIFISLGGQIIVIGPFPPGLSSAPPPATGDGAYANGFGIAHLGLRVADVVAAVTELEAAGVEILSAPVTEDTGLTYAYLAAPDGVVIELTQYA